MAEAILWTFSLKAATVGFICARAIFIFCIVPSFIRNYPLLQSQSTTSLPYLLGNNLLSSLPCLTPSSTPPLSASLFPPLSLALRVDGRGIPTSYPGCPSNLAAPCTACPCALSVQGGAALRYPPSPLR